MSLEFVVEPLTREHDRRSFACGVDTLDRYLKEQATQDIRRGVTSCYIARPSENAKVVGYYTIAMGSVPLGDFPPEIVRKLPRYPSVPVARVGRLAVDAELRGRGLGSVLLLNAIARVHGSDIAAFAVVVDAENETAATFYLRNGFVRFESVPQRLFFPLGEFARRSASTKPATAGREKKW